MRSIRHIIFVAVFAVILLGPIVVFTSHVTGLPLPAWVGDTNYQLQLEGRKTRDIPELSIKAINDGSFQEDVEYAISDHTPMRNNVLIASGRMQRLSIEQMAYIYGYSIYPSYFGSKYLYEPEESAIWHEPIKADPEMEYEPRMHTFGEGIVAVAERHPDIRFCIMMPAGGAMPAVNPAYDLVANPQYPEPLLAVLEQEVEDSPNITLVSNIGYYKNSTEYYADYLRTDHHWNAHGCARIYNEAAVEMGFPEIQTEPEIAICESVGSYARNSRVIISETDKDIPQKTPGVYLVYQSETDSQPQTYAVDDHAFFDPESSGRFFDFYNTYYKQVETYVGPGTGSALLICDSFAAPMIAPLASNYETVHRVEDLLQRPGGSSLEAYIEEMHPDDVWIVGIPADFMALVRREPGYFDAE